MSLRDCSSIGIIQFDPYIGNLQNFTKIDEPKIEEYQLSCMWQNC